MLTATSWSSYQSYKDRRPPWIRLHKTLLDNYEFQSMGPDARALLPMLWLLASENKDPTSGIVEDPINKIAFRLRLDEGVLVGAIEEIVAAGFFLIDQSCNETVTEPLQNRNETVTPETEKRQRRVETTLSRSRDPEREILLHLNAKTGKNFHPVDTNLNLLTARINEGHSQETILAVIDRKCAEWGDSEKWKKFLRPKTLFTATNFNNYVGELTVKRELTEEEKTDAWIRGEDPEAPGAIDGEFSHVT